MNEEQKQAIKELKHFTNMTVFWKEKEYTSHEIDNCINIVLHLIEKQQKEIEELDKENTRQQELIGNIHQKWKDKIKEKMRGEINKSWRNTEQRKCRLYAYDILKELLGE